MNIFKQRDNFRIFSRCRDFGTNIDTDKHIPLFILNQGLYYNLDERKGDKKPLPLLESSLSSSLAEGYNHYKIFNNIKLIDLPSRYQSKLNLGNSIILSSGLYYAYRYLSLIGSGAYITFKNGSSSDLEYLFCLCVKKGYERYIQLCIITKTEIEFDCLYFMYRKDLVNEHNNQIYKFLFNKVMKYCKDYRIETIPVDDLTLELDYSVDLLSGVKNRIELNERCELIKEQALLNF